MDVATALGTYLEIVDSCAPGLVEGLYVVGSYALDDWHEGTSDIDIVAVTADPATDDDAGALRTAHALLAEHLPRPFVDGPYVAWGDLVVPPMGLHRPWALEHAFHHDGECFELNPITWYVLATYGVTVRGPSTDRLGIYLDTDERIRFVRDNLVAYWRPLAREVATTAMAPDAPSDVPATLLVWCALGALRLHHTSTTGDVIGKTAAGSWGLEIAPDRFHPVLHRAIELRRAADDTTPVPLAELVAAAELISWCVDDVVGTTRRGG